MSEQDPETVTCVDRRTHELPEVLKLFLLFLQMIAAAGGMVLILAVQALITAWSGCALAMRSLTPAGRNAFRRMCMWRQGLYVFYLGSVAGRPSRQEPWSGSPELAPVRAEAPVPFTSGPRMKHLECSVGDR